MKNTKTVMPVMFEYTDDWLVLIVYSNGDKISTCGTVEYISKK